MPKGKPFSPELKSKAVARVQELIKTGAAPSAWSALVQVARDLNCSPETVRVWLSKPPTPPKRRGRPPKSVAAAAQPLAERARVAAAAVEPTPTLTTAAEMAKAAELVKERSGGLPLPIVTAEELAKAWSFPKQQPAQKPPASSQDTATALGVARVLLANAMDILKQLEAVR